MRRYTQFALRLRRVGRPILAGVRPMHNSTLPQNTILQKIRYTANFPDVIPHWLSYTRFARVSPPASVNVDSIIFYERLCFIYGQAKFYSGNLLRKPLFIFEVTQKWKALLKKVWEKGVPSSLSLRRDKRISAARYSCEITSKPTFGLFPRPNSANLIYRPLSGTAPIIFGANRG